MPEKTNPNATVPARSRLVIGAGLLALSLGSPVFIPLVLMTGLSAGAKTTLSGLLVFGIPQAITLLAIAIVGKPGFLYIKSKAFGLLKKFGPADSVNRARYRIGLIMFILPLLLGWLSPYLGAFVENDYFNHIAIGVVGDLVFISSIFVLGGDFWDKVRALFVHDAKAVFPESIGKNTEVTDA